MALVRGRHIRHDWRTFNAREDQKSVKTLCNVTSTPAKAGIPYVTRQRVWLVSDEIRMWSWCWGCTRRFITEVLGDDIEHAHERIKLFYKDLYWFVNAAQQAQKEFVDIGGRIMQTPTFPNN